MPEKPSKQQKKTNVQVHRRRCITETITNYFQKKNGSFREKKNLQRKFGVFYKFFSLFKNQRWEFALLCFLQVKSFNLSKWIFYFKSLPFVPKDLFLFKSVWRIKMRVLSYGIIADASRFVNWNLNLSSFEALKGNEGVLTSRIFYFIFTFERIS